MPNTDDLVARLLECDVQLTDNPWNALYILDDGRMIDGEYNFGVRGQDHRIIECGLDYDRYTEGFWDRLHSEYRVVRLVPESKMALIKVGQGLTDVQKEILNALEFSVEEY